MFRGLYVRVCISLSLHPLHFVSNRVSVLELICERATQAILK